MKPTKTKLHVFNFLANIIAKIINFIMCAHHMDAVSIESEEGSDHPELESCGPGMETRTVNALFLVFRGQGFSVVELTL